LFWLLFKGGNTDEPVNTSESELPATTTDIKLPVDAQPSDSLQETQRIESNEPMDTTEFSNSQENTQILESDSITSNENQAFSAPDSSHSINTTTTSMENQPTPVGDAKPMGILISSETATQVVADNNAAIQFKDLEALDETPNDTLTSFNIHNASTFVSGPDTSLLLNASGSTNQKDVTALAHDSSNDKSSTNKVIKVETPKAQQSYENSYLQQQQQRRPIENPNIFDPLSTLASAAVSSALSAQNEMNNSLAPASSKEALKENENGNASAPSAVPQSLVRPLPTPEEDDKKEGWADVAHTKYTVLQVKQYFNVNEKLSNLNPDADVCRDLEFIKKRVELQPGTAYKFRVAAINACGRGPWSEVHYNNYPNYCLILVLIEIFILGFCIQNMCARVSGY
jgi:hypothetical protein